MRNRLLKILLVFVGFLTSSVLCYAYVFWWSSAARAGARNERHSYSVLPGMTVPQALQNMGPPLCTGFSWDSSAVYYRYQARPGASDDVSFSVGPNGRISRVNHGTD
jgi:hypothetical protein